MSTTTESASPRFSNGDGAANSSTPSPSDLEKQTNERAISILTETNIGPSRKLKKLRARERNEPFTLDKLKEMKARADERFQIIKPTIEVPAKRVYRVYTKHKADKMARAAQLEEGRRSPVSNPMNISKSFKEDLEFFAGMCRGAEDSGFNVQPYRHIPEDAVSEITDASQDQFGADLDETLPDLFDDAHDRSADEALFYDELGHMLDDTLTISLGALHAPTQFVGPAPEKR